MPMPTVKESLKRTEKTLNLVKEEEKKQNLPWSNICQKQVNEEARNQERSELTHQEFHEAQRRTRRTIVDYERDKRGEEAQAKLEGYVNLFEQLDRVTALQEAERLAELERHRRACEG